MSEELKQFNIDINDIKPNDELFDNIRKAVDELRLVTLKDKFEVVLNNNLIKSKEKLTNFRTIIGCRISYENLDKNISFIVREDIKPSYEVLEQQLQEKEKIIEDAIEYVKTCNPDVDLNSMFLNESYISNYGAKELLSILERK